MSGTRRMIACRHLVTKAGMNRNSKRITTCSTIYIMTITKGRDDAWTCIMYTEHMYMLIKS